METINLASQSPRRREMLKRVGIPFHVIPPQVEEEPYLLQATKKTAGDLAGLKVRSVADSTLLIRPAWVLSADTIVEIDGRVLGKPSTSEEAAEFLRLLSGRIHQVHTGVALCSPHTSRVEIEVCSTNVAFKKMTEEDISFYIASSEWSGAAGAYRIQERGGFFVEFVQGSYSNVVGLPMETLYIMLKRQNYQFGV